MQPATKKQKTSSTVTLYSYWRSSCSWRVRIALAMKEIQYDYVAVHLLNNGGEQLAENYATKNPSRELPTLEIDGLCLAQSVPIIEYLEETRSNGPHLLPSDPAQRAVVRRVSEIIASGIQPVQNLRVLKYVMAKHEEPAEKTKQKLAWGKHWITDGFVALEAVLADTAGTCCVGDEVTMADCCLVPQVYNANRFGCDMTKFPIITKINEHLCQLSPFIAAHPSKQPDAQ